MKRIKKLLSIVLAMVMVLSMSSNVFAEEITAPYINVEVLNSRSGQTSTWQVSATAGQSVKAALDDVEKDESELVDGEDASDVTIKWKPVADYLDSSIIHYALIDLRGFESAGFDSSCEQDCSLLAEEGYDYEDITWYTDAYQGYGLIDYNETTGQYTYIYAGYDWTYSSNLSANIWDYMCCYYVQENEIIQLVYDFTVSVWTSTSPLV